MEYTIDCLAKPITHVFVEFQSTKIRERYVRSAGMQKVELNGRTVRISPVLDAEKSFHRKRLGFIKCTIRKIKGIALLSIQMSYEKRNITIDVQVIAKIDASGKLKYNRYVDVDEDVQILMTKHVEGLNPAPHIHEQKTTSNYVYYGYDIAYNFTHNNIMLEHNAMNNMDTVAHMNVHNTQY